MTRQSHHPAAPLTRRHMPGDDAISLDRYTRGRTVRIPDEFGPAQEMTGFEPTYANIVDYIVRITHRIWEDRDADYIGASYAPDSRVFDDFGLQTGNRRIVDNTRRTLGSSSDMVLDAEEVIWAGDAQVGFRSSHRVRMGGTHDGPGDLGPATGRRTDVLVLANCVSKANDIFLEQVLYNSTALMMQMGLDPREEAARMAADPPDGWPRDAATWAALRTEGAPTRPLCEAEPVDGFDPDRFARDLHRRVWGEGDRGAVRDLYAPGFAFEGGSLRASEGAEAHADMVAAFRRQFADIALRVDEVYWMGNDADGYRIATRWSIDAVHDGESDGGGGAYAGDFGPATGAPVQIWGITQQTVRGGRVEAEWTLTNELDILIQIAAARLAADRPATATGDA